MKKIFLALTGLLCVTMIMLEADLVALPKVNNLVKPKNNCFGYTIIAVDKGINCKGDTVRLTKKFGYYQVISNDEKPVSANFQEKTN